jgi:hypothetical protein
MHSSEEIAGTAHRLAFYFSNKIIKLGLRFCCGLWIDTSISYCVDHSLNSSVLKNFTTAHFIDLDIIVIVVGVLRWRFIKSRGRRVTNGSCRATVTAATAALATVATAEAAALLSALAAYLVNTLIFRANYTAGLVASATVDTFKALKFF